MPKFNEPKLGSVRGGAIYNDGNKIILSIFGTFIEHNSVKPLMDVLPKQV